MRYGNFIDQNNTPISAVSIKAGLALSYATLEDLSEVSGFEFIYIPTGDELGIELINKGLENQMLTDTATDPLTFYLFYYESSENSVKIEIISEGLNQVSITDYITGYHLRKCLLESLDESIIQIGNNNKFIINGTGLVKITVTTPYNIYLTQDLYIYVINYTNNISAFLSSDKIRNEIKTDDKLVFDAVETTRFISHLG